MQGPVDPGQGWSYVRNLAQAGEQHEIRLPTFPQGWYRAWILTEQHVGLTGVDVGEHGKWGTT
jgi:hypothetical protein